MKVSLKPVSEQVIVITGASSGIGLATAQAAAKKGARLVLASRNEGALRDIVDSICAKGGEALHVAADVGKQDDVRKIAKTAMDAFGGFDTWVNDAGTGIFGPITAVSEEDNRRLFDTNFWGVVNGSLTAVEHLKDKGGALINLGSVASDQPVPSLGMYAASKHAVRGFTDTLRLELIAEGAPVSVTLIKPAAVNTPFFEHARNYTGEEQKAPSPLYAPEEVARAILYAAGHPVKDLNVGAAGRFASYMPGIAAMFSSGKENKAAVANGITRKGNLHKPARDGNIHGAEGRGRISLYTRSRMHPVATGLTFAAVGLLSAYAANKARE